MGCLENTSLWPLFYPQRWNTPKVELLRSEQLLLWVEITKRVLLRSYNTATSFRFSCDVPLNCASASHKPELTRDTHVFPNPPETRDNPLETVVSLKWQTPFIIKIFLPSVPEKTLHVSITLWDRKGVKWKSSHRVFCAAAPIFFPLISSVCIQLSSYPPSVRALNELSVILSCRFQSLISWAGIH